jgi:hypothetical protein
MVNHQWNEEDLAIQKSRDVSTANEDMATAKGAQMEAAGGVAKAAGQYAITINGNLNLNGDKSFENKMGSLFQHENKRMGIN